MVLTLNQFHGFELGNVDIAATAGSPTFNITDPVAPGGSERSARLNVGSDEIDINLFDHVADAGGNYVFGFKIRFSDATQNAFFFFEARNSTSHTVRMFIQTDGDVEIRDSSVLLATVTNPFSDLTWHRVEFFHQPGDSGTSTWEFFVDGVSLAGASDGSFGAGGNNETFFRFPGSTGLDVWIDDVWMYSDAADADDRIGNGVVKAYPSDTTGTTPDVVPVSGDSGTLDNGDFGNLDEIPFSDAAFAGYTGTADSGVIDHNGPSGDADAAGSTIKGYKYCWRLDRGNGGSTTHSVYWGDDSDAPTWPSARTKTVSLTTTPTNFFELSEVEGPTLSEFAAMGFRTGGPRDITCFEQFAQLLFVPPAATEAEDAENFMAGQFQPVNDPEGMIGY